MGQFSVASSPYPMPRNKKLIVAAVAVVVGHVGVLWGLAHMKPIQLRPIEPPKPVQVRFVKIVEKPKAEVPKPTEKPKPKEPPKQVKIVEKPQPPKPVPKIQQVKAPTPQPQPVEQPPQPEPKVIAPVVVAKPVPVAQPSPPPAPKVDTSPRDLGDASGVAWKRKPRPRLTQDDLKDVTNTMVVIRIDVDESGHIRARIKQSSGSAKVDKEVIRAVQAGQFYPYKENGAAVSFFAEQPFHLQ